MMIKLISAKTGRVSCFNDLNSLSPPLSFSCPLQSPGEGERTFITQGKWEVSRLLAIDERVKGREKVFYLGNGPKTNAKGDARERHLYR